MATFQLDCADVPQITGSFTRDVIEWNYRQLLNKIRIKKGRKHEFAHDTVPDWTDSKTFTMIEVWKPLNIQDFFLSSFVEDPPSIFYHYLCCAVPYPTSAPLLFSNFSGA